MKYTKVTIRCSHKKGDIRLEYSCMMLIMGEGNVFTYDDKIRFGELYSHGCKTNCQNVFRKTEKKC